MNKKVLDQVQIIRYYGYVGVPIITHNFNSTSTVDHVLLLHLKMVA